MLRKGIALIVILLFIGISIIPSTAQEKSNISSLAFSDKKKTDLSFFRLEYPKPGLYYYIPPFQNWLKNKIPYSDYIHLKGWGNKPFSNPTIMFVGNGIGFRPFLNITIFLLGFYPDLPGSINVYSDEEYYDTIYPEFFGPISSRYYILNYYAKGFHSLSFVAGDKSYSIDIDVQIGFIGFIEHILPYLIK